MIVRQVGYRKIKEIDSFDKEFSIYKTHKGTTVLIFGCHSKKVDLFYPKYDRLPYKIIEGKKIFYRGEKIFDSKTDKKFNKSLLSDKIQIICYKPYVLAN